MYVNRYATSTYTAQRPATAWLKVAVGGKSWKFSDRGLADQCVAYFRARGYQASLTNSTAPEPRWASRANPRPGAYY